MLRSSKVGAGSVYGALEILILKTLEGSSEPMHGLAIARRIGELSEEFLQIEEGALYPALHRLQRQRLIDGEWRISEKRRRAKFYELTKAGRKAVQRDVKQWVRRTKAISKVLNVPAEDLT